MASPAVQSRVSRRLTIHDPDARVLHRAIRVTLVLTAMMAFGEYVVDDPALSLFGAFGAFALLGFADFGGSLADRTRAYLVLVAVGSVMVALGTLVSEQVVAAALCMAVVSFLVAMTSVFGGDFVAGAPAARLVFVVAVMVPGPPSEIGSRELGWLLGGAISIVVASLLWPVHERRDIRLAAAEVAEALAQLLRRDPAPGADEFVVIQERFDSLRERYGRTALRPAGPTRRDQALVRLIDELQGATAVAIRLEELDRWPRTTHSDDTDPSLSEDLPLLDAVSDTLEHAALVLRGAARPEATIDLDQVRASHRTALETWVADTLRAGGSAESIARRLARAFRIRVLSHAALSCDRDATVACGGNPTGDEPEPVLEASIGGGVGPTVKRAGALLRPHLRSDSVLFRNALRSAVALSAALVVANVVHDEHGQWVVLGTITVLKSNAMRTGITAIQSIVGNLIGFLLASVVLVAVGDQKAVLWILLPIAVFLAGYAPSAIHFVVGQASFAIFVVVMMNIIEPAGWQVGLIRVESVALGAAVSLVVGIAFWPRGSREAVRRATANLYLSVAGYLDASFDALLHPAGRTNGGRSALPPTVVAARSEARDAELIADAATFDLLATPPPAETPVAEWMRLTTVGRSLRLVGDGVSAISLRGYEPLVDGRERDRLAILAEQRVGEVAAVAGRIDHGRAAAPTEDAVAALVQWLSETSATDDAAVGRLMSMVWAVEWIGYVDTLIATDREPIEAVSATAGTPWWR